MHWFKQLEFAFLGGTRSPSVFLKSSSPPSQSYGVARDGPIHLRGRDHALESQARELLHSLGANKLAREICVEWNPRMRTCAGRADYRAKLISLNPLLLELADGPVPNKQGAGEPDRFKRSSLTSAAGVEPHAIGIVSRKLDCLKQSSLRALAERASGKNGRTVVSDELERTLRHELAHLLAQWRVGRRRIAPHGTEWREACRDLGIADEARCHNLPFALKVNPPRYLYRCPNCKEEFPRARKIRRAIACLACCRRHNHGEFNSRFRLKLIRRPELSS